MKSRDTPSYIHIVLSIVNQSCISSFYSSYMRAQLNVHTQKYGIHKKTEILCLERKGGGGETLPGASLHSPVFLCDSQPPQPCPRSLPWHK